jgi:hypothetical protein
MDKKKAFGVISCTVAINLTVLRCGIASEENKVEKKF